MGRAGRVTSSGTRARTLLYILFNSQVLLCLNFLTPNYSGPGKEHHWNVRRCSSGLQEHWHLPEGDFEEKLRRQLRVCWPGAQGLLLQHLWSVKMKIEWPWSNCARTICISVSLQITHTMLRVLMCSRYIPESRWLSGTLLGSKGRHH